ncbi:MAG: hypothetical protein ACOCW6_02790 [Spirochaetota bacterium]
MSTPQDVVRILQSYTKRTRKAVIAFQDLLDFTDKYLSKYAEEFPDLADLDDNTSDLLAAHLMSLEKEGRCSLEYRGGRIVEIDYLEFYPLVINAAYSKIKAQTHMPFPTEESLPLSLPEQRITAVNIKEQFVDWLAKTDQKPTKVLRLIFPEGIRSIICTNELLARFLPELAVHKMRNYLRIEKNAGFMRSRLLGVFRNRDMALKEFLDKIQTNPSEALNSVLFPNDFTFHVWTTMCSVVVKEFSKKKDKLQEDYDYEQAAYLLGYYNVFHKAIVQKKRETETALRGIDNNLKKPPYVFSTSDIYGFTDSKGIPLAKHCTVEEMNEHLRKRLTPKEDETLPELIRFKGTDDKDYYIRKESVLRYLIEALYEISREFQDYYVGLFKKALENDEKPKIMLEDQPFADEVSSRLRAQEPIVSGLLSYDLLSVCVREQKPQKAAADEITRILDPKNRGVRPAFEVLKLDRRELYRQAKILLPFWQAFPLFRGIVKFFIALMIGDPKAQKKRRKQRSESGSPAAGDASGAPPIDQFEEGTMQFGSRPAAGSTGGGVAAPASPSTNTRKAQSIAFRETVQKLQEEYVAPGRTVKATLEELAEKWNPLLDPLARQNLVEDVNSLVRDFLRRMRVGARLVPPDRERIRELSAKLAQNDAFSEVRQKEPLRRYLELYMITVLGKQ